MTLILKDIKRYSVTCKQCKTVIIADIGKSVEICPCCSTRFISDAYDNPLIKLADTLADLRQRNNATFGFVVDDE